MNTRRIERAKELLRQNPNMNVAEIAEAVGYNNTPSLTRNFRKLEGLTPSEYRALRL
jgi:YesN/AraC family two-component response regulator